MSTHAPVKQDSRCVDRLHQTSTVLIWIEFLSPPNSLRQLDEPEMQKPRTGGFETVQDVTDVLTEFMDEHRSFCRVHFTST